MPQDARGNPWALLKPRAPDGLTVVVVETPRGSRNKYKFDHELGVFRLSKVLPAGMSFPYDFGFVPGTLAEDGDALDVLLLIDEPVPIGCVVYARLIGVIGAVQRKGGKRRERRNDRLVAVAGESLAHRGLRSLGDLPEGLLGQIEHFFASYHEQEGDRFEATGRRGPGHALKLLKAAVRAAAGAED